MSTPPLRFVPPAPLLPSRGARRRPLGNKLQEIASRSPKDLAAFEVIADLVLDRLDEDDRRRRNA